jgi:glycosyltransferase involved in cell wall biosynthesis
MIYCGFYYCPEKSRTAEGSAAAAKKTDYVASLIKKEIDDVTILSPCWLTGKSGFQRGFVTHTPGGVTVRYGASFCSKNPYVNKLSVLVSLSWLFVRLMRSKKGEVIFAYHSPYLAAPLRFVKALKSIKIILEVEEKYSQAYGIKGKPAFRERRLFDIADAYVFSNGLLADDINISSKPQTVLYGVYRARPRIITQGTQHIHIVYAGVIDKNEGGAAAAARAAEYVPDNYRVHIIGHGDAESLTELKKLIDGNPELTNKVRFDGLKQGAEYEDYMGKCHIGLNPRKTDARYGCYAFPSKVVDYLSLGLRVVSSRMECIVQSPFDGYVCYCESVSASDIAKAITAASLGPQPDITVLFRRLERDFAASLKKIYCELK